MDEIEIETIEWSAPEYNHKYDRHIDWFWTIGLITLVACGIAIWFHNYIFSIFIFLSGACLILFTIKPPEDLNIKIDTSGISMGREFYEWKKVKGFHIIKNKDNNKLLIEVEKYFLPVYTLPLPTELINKVKENLLKITQHIELKESQSMLFMEKIGF